MDLLAGEKVYLKQNNFSLNQTTKFLMELKLSMQ